ncbi:MAG: hypothetical protein ACQETE_12780 [Bacteroidota bacterium]
MNAAIKLPTYGLSSVTPKSEEQTRSFADIQSVLEVMGWNDLPADLLEVIHSDLLAYKYELTGEYATSSRFVYNRRKRIVKWIDTFRAGNCDLDTIIDALKVRSI